jgi:hypothetical protein
MPVKIERALDALLKIHEALKARPLWYVAIVAALGVAAVVWRVLV